MADQELSREEQFANTIAEAREAGLLEGEAKPEPKVEKPEKVEAKPDAKPRDGTGKFVKNEGQAVPEPVEPFAGFKELPKDVQDQWNTLLGRSKQLDSEVTQLRRQNGALLGQVPNLQREVQRLSRSSREAPTQQKAADLTAQLQRFKEYKERYPEDAAAIEELIGSTRQELADTKAELANKVSQIEHRLGSFENERTVQENKGVQDQLDREHPDWRVIAGWVDANGNAVDPNVADYHPHFKAWQSALPAEIQADFADKLKSRSAHLIGHVFEAFERDYKRAVEATEGRGAETASDADPVRERRAEALRDVSPTGSASSNTPADRSLLSPRNAREEDFAATVAKYRHLFPHWGT